ncbi:Uncharacterized protein dnm_067930 [Desulfonema magnum]|uniref:Uncharacterized protein n=1 Tax=Desulfonema magnum TaxID=45655 RepID=A0A975GRA9_9BACT|nr:Uncharacterized protein dnm_067930 [Desulfonema magnum]
MCGRTRMKTTRTIDKKGDTAYKLRPYLLKIYRKISDTA